MMYMRVNTAYTSHPHVTRPCKGAPTRVEDVVVYHCIWHQRANAGVLCRLRTADKVHPAHKSRGRGGAEFRHAHFQRAGHFVGWKAGIRQQGRGRAAGASRHGNTLAVAAVAAVAVVVTLRAASCLAAARRLCREGRHLARPRGVLTRGEHMPLQAATALAAKHGGSAKAAQGTKRVSEERHLAVELLVLFWLLGREEEGGA